MAEIGCNWARIGPSKSSQSLSIAHKWAVSSDVTSTPLVIAPSQMSHYTIAVSPGHYSFIHTEATTITTSLPEITPFIALQLRVARLEQEMSKVKKTDHSTDVLASIKS
ncbi:hypothetical protein Tco_0635081 [Tanacetum coccineum]